MVEPMFDEQRLRSRESSLDGIADFPPPKVIRESMSSMAPERKDTSKLGRRWAFFPGNLSTRCGMPTAISFLQRKEASIRRIAQLAREEFMVRHAPLVLSRSCISF